MWNGLFDCRMASWETNGLINPFAFFFFFFFQFGSKEGYLTKLGGKVKVRKHILPLSRSDYKFSCLTSIHFLIYQVWEFLVLLRQFTFGETKIINFFSFRIGKQGGLYYWKMNWSTLKQKGWVVELRHVLAKITKLF